jgi:hypothetical protein
MRNAPTFLAGVPSLLLDDEEEAGGDGGPSSKDADGIALPPSLDSVRRLFSPVLAHACALVRTRFGFVR